MDPRRWARDARRLMGHLPNLRMGRVPELNYLKFLEMVGIELAPARPATTVLAFPVQAGFLGDRVAVPARTAVEAAQPDAQGPVVVGPRVPADARLRTGRPDRLFIDLVRAGGDQDRPGAGGHRGPT